MSMVNIGIINVKLSRSSDIIMANIKESDFTKRLKSLVWRTAMLGIAFALSQIVQGLSSLQLDPSITVFLGLVLGEISKYLNTKAGK